MSGISSTDEPVRRVGTVSITIDASELKDLLKATAEELSRAVSALERMEGGRGIDVIARRALFDPGDDLPAA